MPGMPNLFTNCNPGGTYESGYAQACLFNRHVGMRAEKKEAITTWHFKIGAAVPLALFTALIARIIDTPAPVGRVQYKSSEIPGGTTLPAPAESVTPAEWRRSAAWRPVAIPSFNRSERYLVNRDVISKLLLISFLVASVDDPPAMAGWWAGRETVHAGQPTKIL